MLRAHVLSVIQRFCAEERLKLRRYLIDRLRCELDLSDLEAESELQALEGEGLIRAVEISHYDPALEDIATEPAILPGSGLARVG
jgi:hypothetical protein